MYHCFFSDLTYSLSGIYCFFADKFHLSDSLTNRYVYINGKKTIRRVNKTVLKKEDVSS